MPRTVAPFTRMPVPLLIENHRGEAHEVISDLLTVDFDDEADRNELLGAIEDLVVIMRETH